MRYLASIALALIVSLGLFWGMDKLVNKERHELVSNDDLRMVEFIRIKPDEKIQEKKRELPKPPPPKRPPPPPEMKVTATVKPVMDQIPMDMPNLTYQSMLQVVPYSVTTRKVVVLNWLEAEALFLLQHSNLKCHVKRHEQGLRKVSF